MLVERDRGERTHFDCIGFAEFTTKLEDDEFSDWFTNLAESIKSAANDPDPDQSRLIQLQHGLIDLIDFLDPNRTRIPNNRDKISNVRNL